MKDLVRTVSAACLAGALLIAGAAAAQQPQQRGPDLNGLLHLRPDQQAAYHAYMQGVTPPQGIIATLRASGQRAMSMTTPQRLDLESQNLALEQTIFQHQADATRKFYTALSPDQQRTFDQITAPQMNGQGPR